jgi:hypothetical protein
MYAVSAGWEWLEGDQTRSREAEATKELDSALRANFSRAFDSEDGRSVINHLKSITLARSLGPSASDAALRHLEGQRQLVIHILALAATEKHTT